MAKTNWLPMSTAPRDGSFILLSFGQDHVSSAAYSPARDMDPFPWKFMDVKNGAPILNGHVDSTSYGPSGWMPLPQSKRSRRRRWWERIFG